MSSAKNRFLFLVVFFSISASCRKDKNGESDAAFDMVLVMGQSNTHCGFGIDTILDKESQVVKQLGRYDSDNLQIIPAKEPMQHHTFKKNTIGFALTFAKLYAENYLEKNRTVLIIPCGKAGSAFFNHAWNKGDTLYEDAISRVRFVLHNFPKSRLTAILWHQGESDVSHAGYQESLDHFIYNIRKDLGIEKIPFILGGMVPEWVNQDAERINQQSIIQTTPQRISNTGYADPSSPFVIEGDTNLNQSIHYNSVGLREMGTRYFLEYVALR